MKTLTASLRIPLLILCICLLGLPSSGFAQDSTVVETATEPTTTVEKAETVDPTPTNTTDPKITIEEYKIKQRNTLIICGAFFIVMIILLILFFRHLEKMKQYMGFQSIKYVGLALMFPGICILALIGGKELIPGSTLAALLGTIAGYVLSRERDDNGSSSSKSDDKEIDALKSENADLSKNQEELQAQIEALKTELAKTQNP